MVEDTPPVIYWDSSAILSALFEDSHSNVATSWSRLKTDHLISTLAYAETCAVVSRMKREKVVMEETLDAVLQILGRGPWRHLALSPDREIMRPLSAKWSLRGADLWHLSVAKTLQTRIPETHLLTFDRLLDAAARGEGLVKSSRKDKKAQDDEVF